MNIENKKLLIGLGVIFLALGGIFFWRNNKLKKPTAVPSPEEIMVHQEEGMVKKTGEETKLITEEEARRMREEIDAVLSGQNITSAVLKDVSRDQITGEAKRAFSDGKFYHKVEVSGLEALEKGFYYEGWLMKPDGSYISTGRVEVDILGSGRLYYSTSVDKSEYSKVAVTLEPEDGNPQPAENVLEGEF